MSKDAKRALTEQLGAAPPAGLRKLSEAELSDLTEAIRAARHRQAQALDQAADRALGRIPRLLRGPIRKIAG